MIAGRLSFMGPFYSEICGGVNVIHVYGNVTFSSFDVAFYVLLAYERT